jgi:hypothetical protein
MQSIFIAFENKTLLQFDRTLTCWLAFSPMNDFLDRQLS